MTVKELIEKLEGIEDKNLEVYCSIYSNIEHEWLESNIDEVLIVERETSPEKEFVQLT